MSQLSFFTESTDWVNSVHSKERNAYGQQYLNINRIKLGIKNKMVFEYLMTGAELDGNIAETWTPKIKFLNSRISDLSAPKSKYKFHISRRYDKQKNLTVYWMSESDRNYNSTLLPGLLK